MEIKGRRVLITGASRGLGRVLAFASQGWARKLVVSEILRHIRKETIDPPIGEESEGIPRWAAKRRAGMEKIFARIRA
jgi:NAD(P)-dependent dehydrogenase (short-subunit alcohol dehydrogenase family)